jgi:aryl-alcohol dehydrogenase-like predicted oxidoreductase
LDWSPLAGGALTGKHLRGETQGRVATGAVGHFDKYRTPDKDRIIESVVAAAAELGCSAAQLALAWLRRRSPMHIPIIGARTRAHLEDNLGACNLHVPDDTMTRLDKASAIALGFPMDFLPKGWPHWFGDGPRRLDPRCRPAGREVLGLDLEIPR